MQYIDSGARHESQALGFWLNGILSEEVTEVRWQSGFFSADSLGILQKTLKRLALDNSPVRALVGSNDRSTSKPQVEHLLRSIQMPRDEAYLGVVAFRNSYFHPKTFHVRRSDGSQAGYVGSANLTGAGVASLHVEAAMTLDTREGDALPLLNTMALAVDAWFSETRMGFYPVRNLDDVWDLTDRGILSEVQVFRPPVASEADQTYKGPRDRLEPLFKLPRATATVLESARPIITTEAITKVLLPSAPRPGYPPYLLFAPAATHPTNGLLALSGASLPGGSAGLIITLNRDNARHFESGEGTANISVPVATLGTIRFGVYTGKSGRPRAEYPLEIRYVSNERSIGPFTAESNIMAYGFDPDESGHGDVRLLLPKPPFRSLIGRIKATNGELPAIGDFGCLEWPTPSNQAVIRLTFLDRLSAFHVHAAKFMAEASTTQSTVGPGACWLPPDFFEKTT